MRWEELHHGVENSRWAVPEKPSVKISRKWDIIFGREWTPGFTPSGRRFKVRSGHWTRSAGRGMLTKPQPPAWSQGGTKPEYFMAPPSTKRLQNWPGSFGAVCSLKVRTWKQRQGQKTCKRKGQTLNTYLMLNNISFCFTCSYFSIGEDLKLTSSASIIFEHSRLTPEQIHFFLLVVNA